jgi:hypothetical protein
MAREEAWVISRAPEFLLVAAIVEFDTMVLPVAAS